MADALNINIRYRRAFVSALMQISGRAAGCSGSRRGVAAGDVLAEQGCGMGRVCPSAPFGFAHVSLDDRP
jgi:hypothetical protein